jgi:hypothetical protein
LKSFGTVTLTPDECRAAIRSFYEEVIEAKSQEGRVYLSLPLMNAEGYQVTIAIEQVADHRAVLTDLGETLAFLDSRGIPTRLASIRERIDSRAAAFGIEQHGKELSKTVALPLQGLDVQLFAEALSGLTHVIFRSEHSQPRSSHVYHRVADGLRKANIPFVTGRDALIAGSSSKLIQVEFLLGAKVRAAIKTVQRKGRMHDYMEQWGFRWADARQAEPTLVRVMLYDPEHQEWDENSLKIGEQHCEIFRPYHELELLRDDLARFNVVE